MKTEELLSEKDDFLILQHGGEASFFMPIFPALLRKDAEIKNSAEDVFPKAVAETERELGRSPNIFYETICWENGLVREFMLNEHVGLLTQVTGRYFIPPYHPEKSNYVRFSKGKLNAYSAADEGAEYLADNGPPFGYVTKNTNKVHATLLRNWSVEYLNDALKEYMKINKI
ncbi:MAG: hypothetical protein WA139_04730 [Candidatus Aenigmatarchaeota archaeon]